MTLNKKQREELRMMFGGRCAYCGYTLERGWCADHVEPIYRNASKLSINQTTGSVVITPSNDHKFPERDVISNFFPSCRACNIHKGVYPLEDWRRELERLQSILHRNYPTYRHAVRFSQIVETPKPIVFHFETWKPHDKGHA
jgi:5-methylcytosine-specific restriction endonuclease McrA